MRSVLGIDAAWTIESPSGVALVAETETGWQLACVESSYERFQCQSEAGLVLLSGARGSKMDADAILDVSHRRLGRAVDLIAVDMPLARSPIRERRVADNAISKEYGALKASTHTPNAERPGLVSDQMTAAFANAGYPLRTDVFDLPGLIEVYPHPALIELTGAKERLRYKYTRSGKYWPNLKPPERRNELLKVWATIIESLEVKIAGVAHLLLLPELSSGGAAMKSFEDKLDAVICAWVGICALTNKARSYGDSTAAIWVPVDQVQRQL